MTGIGRPSSADRASLGLTLFDVGVHRQESAPKLTWPFRAGYGFGAGWPRGIAPHASQFREELFWYNALG
jgi:hypothetical protein